jgi:hypothetical protein
MYDISRLRVKENFLFCHPFDLNIFIGQSRRTHSLTSRCATARLQELSVRIPSAIWMKFFL